jgi:hypothetical protein
MIFCCDHRDDEHTEGCRRVHVPDDMWRRALARAGRDDVLESVIRSYVDLYGRGRNFRIERE